MVDAAGNVVITGRLKDVIIRKGENISAKEVEDALFTHPKVADAAVIGLPDPRSGERACAVVVPADADAPPTLEELFEFLTAGRPDGPEGPRAARDRRRAAAQPVRQGPQARAPRPLLD